MIHFSGNKLYEYIYLKYENYTQGGLGGSRDLSSYRKSLNSSIFNSAQQIDLQKLEQELNNFGLSFSSKGTNETYKDVQKAIMDYINKIADQLETNDINWETLTVKPGAYNKLANVKVNTDLLSIRTLTKGKLGEKIRLSTFTKHMNHIKIYLDQMEKGNTKQKLETEFGKIQEILDLYTNQDFTNASIKKSLGDRIEALANEVIKVQSAVAIEGLLAEAAIAAIYSNLMFCGQKGIEELLGDLQKGTIQFKTQNFIEGILEQKVDNKTPSGGLAIEKNYKKNDETGAYELKMPVKGKVDIIATVNEGQDIGISAKSYRLEDNSPHHKNISLVSGTTLNYLFQSHTHFFNHYLNQTVKSQDQEGRDVGPKSQIRARANKQMRQMLLLLGMAGGGLRTDNLSGAMAQVFIVNDKSSGKKRVFNVAMLVENLIKDEKKINGSLVNISNINEATSWQNTYVKIDENVTRDKAIQQRLWNLYNEVHAKKISVSISKEAIKSYF